MKILRLTLILSLIFSVYCKKKDSTSADEDRIMEPVKVLVYVKDASNNVFTNGQVRLKAKIGEIRYFGSWMEIEREETNALNQYGIAEFDYSADDIDPSVTGIRIVRIQVLDRSFNVLYETTEEIFVDNGTTKRIDLALQ